MKEECEEREKKMYDWAICLLFALQFFCSVFSSCLSIRASILINTYKDIESILSGSAFECDEMLLNINFRSATVRIAISIDFSSRNAQHTIQPF